ncbi:MAG: nitroreductase family deazaflavin-dependent oxidoreductase [Alphaproteobacteria bacterium]
MPPEQQALHDWNTKIIADFRANAGRCGPPFENAEMVILHTRGARTGKPRENPLCALLDRGRLFVFASKAGAPTNPDWYHNLKAHPDVEVEHGTDRFRARAVEVTGPEREALYARQASLMPQFAEYAASTSRVIPVVELAGN